MPKFYETRNAAKTDCKQKNLIKWIAYHLLSGLQSCLYFSWWELLSFLYKKRIEIIFNNKNSSIWSENFDLPQSDEVKLLEYV